MKDKIIHLRIDNEMKELIKYYTKHMGTNSSTYLRQLINEQKDFLTTFKIVRENYKKEFERVNTNEKAKT